MAYFASRPKGKDVERAILRDLLGAGFRLFTRLMVRLPIRDTQCGLKVLPAEAFREIRRELKRNDFAFDIELAMALHENGWSIHEEPIHWREQAGSHVRAVHVLAMAVAVCGFGYRRWFRPAKKGGAAIRKPQLN
jgi:dolichyl-phosphate beta-glucosyltransferase